MQTLKDNIKLVTFLAPATIDEDNSPITATVIDTYGTEPEKFDGALIRALVGTFGANLTSVKVKVHESANSDGSSSALADGGAEQTLTEAGELDFQINRTKRYLVVIITMAASGAADTAPACITGILHNWATPYPIV